MVKKTVEPEIVSKFARWCAGAATRRGCSLRGRKWYDYIDKLGLEDILRETKFSRDDFKQWHEKTVNKLAKKTKVSIGWAAKVVNMLLKVRVYIHKEGKVNLINYIHPPIDSILIKKIWESYHDDPEIFVSKKSKSWFKSIKSIKSIATYSSYKKIIDVCERVAQKKCIKLFEVEYLWDDKNK